MRRQDRPAPLPKGHPKTQEQTHKAPPARQPVHNAPQKLLPPNEPLRPFDRYWRNGKAPKNVDTQPVSYPLFHDLTVEQLSSTLQAKT